MEARRSSYICGVVLGFALGIAAAHLMFSPHGDAARPSAADFQPGVDSLTDFLVTDRSDEETSSGHRAVFALADLPATESPPDAPAQPNQLPALVSAAPLAPRAAKEDGLLKEMIKQELETFAASDREVWYETLRDLPPSDATSILQIWKAMRPEKSSHVDTSGSAAASPTHPAHPARQPASSPPGTIPGRQSASRAIAYHEHNLINAETPSFKRWEPVIVEGPVTIDGHRDVVPAPSDRPQVIAMRIDMTPGELQQTNHPFDLAIVGDGFFTLKLGDTRCFTRCGRFSLNESRQLVIRTADHKEAILEPAIVVPEHCAKLMVREDGTVYGSVHGDGEAAPLGTLQLSMVLNPSALTPIGSGFYQANADSGSAWQTMPQKLGSTVRQGHCERSNVVAERELAAIERLRSGHLQSAIPQSPKPDEPRTAEAKALPAVQ